MCKHQAVYNATPRSKLPSLAHMWRAVYKADEWRADIEERLKDVRLKKDAAIHNQNFYDAADLVNEENIFLVYLKNDYPGDDRLKLSDCPCCDTRETMETSDYLCLWCRYFEEYADV